eukprot:364278-Chlamydomonas_euryale.AAC.9
MDRDAAAGAEAPHLRRARVTRLRVVEACADVMLARASLFVLDILEHPHSDRDYRQWRGRCWRGTNADS